MKIAILTLPLHTNYGGILQAYALQTFLEKMGHSVYIIEQKRQPVALPVIKAPLVYVKRIIKHLLGDDNTIFYEQKVNKEFPIISQYTNLFINKYIHLLQYRKFSDIKETDFDAIIVGSDQVWRPMYLNYFQFKKVSNAYLQFTKNWDICRIAYAASFGTDKWEYTQKETKECGELLRLFNNVSVREDSAVKLCKEHFNVEAKHVLDPTMLLNKEEYIKLFESVSTPKSNGNLLYYILDDTKEKNEIIRKIAEQKGFKPFNVKSKSDNIKSPIKERIQPPLEQWLRGFHDADFIITDSFHACVFSILFNKPFLAIGNKERGLSRFSSLLSMFNLENRLIFNSTDLTNLQEIDWNNVNAILEEKRKDASSFLIKINSKQ